VQGNDSIKYATSILDYVFRELAVSYTGGFDLAHVDPLNPTSTHGQGRRRRHAVGGAGAGAVGGHRGDVAEVRGVGRWLAAAHDDEIVGAERVKPFDRYLLLGASAACLFDAPAHGRRSWIQRGHVRQIEPAHVADREFANN